MASPAFSAVGGVWLGYPNREHGPWLIYIYMGITQGRLVCLGYELWAVDPEEAHQAPPRARKSALPAAPKPIGSTDIRVPLHELLLEAKQQRDVPLERELRRLQEDAPEYLGAFRTLFEKSLEDSLAARPRRGGQRGWGDARYREVADVYRVAAAAGENPRVAVRKKWRVSDSTAAKWIFRARDRGFLGPTSRGKAGEAITELGPAAAAKATKGKRARASKTRGRGKR